MPSGGRFRVLVVPRFEIRPVTARPGILYASRDAWESVMRKSGPGSRIYLEIGVWYDGAQGNIHTSSNDAADFHTPCAQTKS